MTGGVWRLGPQGAIAAGMSAHCLCTDSAGDFESRCNMAMVELEEVTVALAIRWATRKT